MGYNPNVSVVDYMNSNKMNSAFSNRAKLAQQYGIKNYAGTSQQNSQLLGYLQKPIAPTPTKPPVVTKPVVPKQLTYKDMTGADSGWYNAYSKALAGGTANHNDFSKYQDLAGKYGLKQYSINGDALRQMSMRALQGDPQAKAYMQQFGYKGTTGSDLWQGQDVTKEMFDKYGQGFRAQYVKDNPYSDITKNYEMNNYNVMSDWIKNGKPITDYQKESYNNIVNKWNLSNMNDPYVQQQAQLEKDKQAALGAQDVALNQGLGQQDAQNFQMYQQLAQQMANKGLTGSGMAGDAYMRATMGANQNYQQAFSDAATKKTDLVSQYNDAIYKSKVSGQEYQDKLTQQASENATNEQKNQLELAKLQNDQDKWLTTQTGNVYIGGKQVKGADGKPITTVDWNKLTETQRHNLANEGIATDSNAIKREGIAADLQTALMKNKLDYAKLDYNYAKLDANNKIAQDKIKIASDNAQTSYQKAQLQGLGKQLDNITKQITAYQKSGKNLKSDQFKNLVSQYNSLNDQIASVVGGSGF